MNETTKSLIKIMANSGMIPLFSHDDPEKSQEIVEAAYEGGARAIEFTNRKDNGLDVFKHLVHGRKRYPAMMLGVGTVMDADTSRAFLDAGADFIVSPALKPEMSPVCDAFGKPWIPGSATLTEVLNARDLGAEVIKIFPGSVLGPGFVSAVLSVVPDLRLMITGGVEPTPDNLQAWFKAGALCVGLGSNLFSSEIISNHDWEKLSHDVAKAIKVIEKVRSSL